MAIGSNLAGVARVSYEAVGVSEFVSDSHQAERAYRASTEHMSDGAIKLELANERLRRSLARGPSAANQQSRALLGVRRAEAELAGETTRATATIDRQDRAIGRLGRTSGGALGGLTRLRGGAVGLTASLLGGAGLAYALRSTLDAAKEQELVLGQTKLAVEAAGQSYEQYAGQIDKVIRAQSQLGFDDEALLKTFSKFVTRTHDVTEALTLNALAVDVSRGRYIDLEAASQIVLKASLGQSGQLRRLGIDVDKNASSVELLTKLTEAYGDRAEGASTSATAAQDRLNVSLENAKEIVGSGLTPVVADLADEVSDYLNDAGRQEQLQQRVNAAVKDGTAIVRGLARGLRILKSAAEPVVDALGGIENAAQLALIAGIVLKARKAAASFGFIAAASGLTTRKVVADSLVAGAALDVAYRPRVVPVTVVERIGQYGNAPAPGKKGKGGFFGAAGKALSTNAAIIVAAAVVNSGGDSFQSGAYDPKKYPRVARLLRRIDAGEFMTADDLAAIKTVPAGKSVSQLTAAELARLEAFLAPRSGPRGEVTGAGSSRGGQRNDRGSNAGKGQQPRSAGGGGAKGDGLSRLQRLQLATAAADTPREQLAAARGEEAYYRQIASNEKLRGDKLFQARSDLLAAQARRRSIEDQIAADRLADIEKTAAKREATQAAAQRKRLAAAKRLRAAEDKISAEISKANTKSRANLVYDPKTGFFESTKPGGSKASKAGESGKGLTRADFDRMSFELLSSLHGVVGQFGSNVSGGTAQLETHAYAQTDLQRKQLAALERLGAGMWFPGSGYSQSQLGAAGIGSGF